MAWQEAGMAWGARAADWACLQEPFHINSYEALLVDEQVGNGTMLLDVACGAGKVLEKAGRLGATVIGIDASEALLAIAAERVPTATLHCGDMAELPLPDSSVDVVTSVNGFMYGTDAALGEAARVLRPGGRLGMVFWENRADFSGYMQAISKCSPPQEDMGAVPVRLSDPGVAEEMLERAGLKPVARRSVECVAEYRDEECAWRGLASAGPAWSAIDHSGEDRFHDMLMPLIIQFVSRRTGLVRMSATFAHVSALKP